MDHAKASDLTYAFAEKFINMIDVEIEDTANKGKMMYDHFMQEDHYDLYTYIIMPKLKERGFHVDTINGSRSEGGVEQSIRHLRICWHPKP